VVRKTSRLGTQKEHRGAAQKKRDGRNISADSAQGLKSPISKRVCCSVIIRGGAPPSHPIGGFMLEVLSIRHKTEHVLLRLLPQVRNSTRVRRRSNGVSSYCGLRA